MENRCIVCGAIIPEGRMICPLCSEGSPKNTYEKEEQPKSDFYICNSEEEIDEHCSYCGNEFYTITEEDITALLAGKTITTMINDEYGVFISMKKK